MNYDDLADFCYGSNLYNFLTKIYYFNQSGIAPKHIIEQVIHDNYFF